MPVLAVGAEWGYGEASAKALRRVAMNVAEVLITITFQESDLKD